MTKREAIQAMLNDEKVRHNDWKIREYIYMNSFGNIENQYGGNYSIHSMNENGWEIYTPNYSFSPDNGYYKTQMKAKYIGDLECDFYSGFGEKEICFTLYKGLIFEFEIDDNLYIIFSGENGYDGQMYLSKAKFEKCFKVINEVK